MGEIDILAEATALAEAQIYTAEKAAAQAAAAAASALDSQRAEARRRKQEDWATAVDDFATSLAHASGDTLRSFAEVLLPPVPPVETGAASEPEDDPRTSRPWGWELRLTLPGGEADVSIEPDGAPADLCALRADSLFSILISY